MITSPPAWPHEGSGAGNPICIWGCFACVGAGCVCGMRLLLKPGIKLTVLAIGSDMDVLLAIDFNGDKILCVFLRTQWLKPSAGMIFLGRPSIILLGEL